jgi:hypothetical protein
METKGCFSIVSLIGSITGFLVDAVTLINWFVKFRYNVPVTITTTSPPQIPSIEVPLYVETITLLVLVYTLIVFLILGILNVASQGGLYGFISGATFPLFLVWASVFHNLDTYWAILGSFIWASIYFGILLLVFKLFSTGKFLTDIWVNLIIAGVLLTPLAAAWLHDNYGYHWTLSFIFGFLVGNGAWITPLILVITIGIPILILAYFFR